MKFEEDFERQLETLTTDPLEKLSARLGALRSKDVILKFCEENTEYLLDGSLEVPVIKLEDLKKYLSN